MNTNTNTNTLGLAGTVSAASADVQQPNIVTTPNVKAHPAPDAMPGHIRHLGDLQPSYTR